MENQIEKNGFIENQDFVSFDNIIKREKGATIKVNLMKILIFRRLRLSLNIKTELKNTDSLKTKTLLRLIILLNDKMELQYKKNMHFLLIAPKKFRW